MAFEGTGRQLLHEARGDGALPDSAQGRQPGELLAQQPDPLHRRRGQGSRAHEEMEDRGKDEGRDDRDIQDPRPMRQGALLRQEHPVRLPPREGEGQLPERKGRIDKKGNGG